MESKIREIRQKKGIIMIKLSVLSEIQYSRLCMIEKGYSKPNKKEIKRLSKALEVNENDLL